MMSSAIRSFQLVWSAPISRSAMQPAIGAAASIGHVERGAHPLLGLLRHGRTVPWLPTKSPARDDFRMHDDDLPPPWPRADAEASSEGSQNPSSRDTPDMVR